MGMQLGWMVGYALLVESVFGLPGIGAYLHNAVTDQDIFAVLGGVVVIGLIFAITSFCVDLLQIRLDPRIRASLTGASR
jgi:peptide/nickel transport system permease protein